MRQIIFILVIFLSVPAFGQRNKKDEEPVAPVFTEGVAYSLPRTGIRITVRAVKETFEPGPYAAYADLLLGIKDARNKPLVKWALTDIRMETFSEPDPAQVYKALGKAAFLISTATNGCITGINTTVENEQKKISSYSYGISGFRMSDGFSFSNYNETPYQVAGDSTNGYRAFRASIEQKAAEAARKIYDCRAAIFEMATGKMDEFHPDGDAYKVSLEILKTTEKNYVSLFTGRVLTDDQTFNFDYIPATTKGETVFRFTEEKGPVPTSDLSGKPVIAELAVEKALIDNYLDKSKSDNPNAGASGIYYRLPAIAALTLMQDMKPIATARFVMPQFGTVAPMPEELLTGGHAILYHSETGGIKSINKK